MRDDIYEKMYMIEDRHWWFAGKRRIIYSLLERYLASRTHMGPLRLVDLGCGCGRTLQELPAEIDGVGVDSSSVAVEFCRKRGVKARLGSLTELAGMEQASYDAALLADVLEHVEDDAAAVSAAARLLAPGGVMIVTVPAMASLWSRWDEIHGHLRRYSRRDLATALRNDALEEVFVSYCNMFMLPAALAARLAAGGASDITAAQLAVPVWPVNEILKAIFAAERHLLGRIRLPAGLSLVALMRKVPQR